MSQHPIEGLMDVTLEKIKSMVDSNTIIGNPINMADGTLVLPISKVTFGFASGGADFPSKTTKDLFGGGGGAGVSIQPVAFLVVKDGSVRMLQLADTSNSVDRAIGMMPEMVDAVVSPGMAIMSRPTEHTQVMASSFSIFRQPLVAASIMFLSSETGMNAPESPPT